MDVEQLTLEHEGLTLHARAMGDGPLVLCVHGYPDTAETWDGLLPALAEAGYRAVAPYQRGYRPSTAPPDGDFSIEAQGRDVLAWVEHLGGPAALIGHDWGATAVLAATALEPDAVRKLVTLAIPHPRTLKPRPSLAWGARHFLVYSLPWWPERLLRADGFAHTRAIYKRWSPKWEPGPQEFEAIDRCFAQPGSIEAALGFYRAVMRGGLSARGRRSQRLISKRVGLPSMAIAGGTDPVVTVADFEAGAAAHTGPFEVVVAPNSGHFPHREEPELVHRAILRFLGPPA
jgi:pimeloyl-ACP methyl ester carboxylesterase